METFLLKPLVKELVKPFIIFHVEEEKKTDGIFTLTLVGEGCSIKTQ